MITTPNLPPLPDPHGEHFSHASTYSAPQMQAYALAAYQAGRDAGLEEAAMACRKRCYEWADEGGPSSDGYPSTEQITEVVRAMYLEKDIRALKSDAKGGV